MKNGLCRKWICCFNCILLKLNNVFSYIKRKSLTEAWPTGPVMPGYKKKKNDPPTRQPWEFVTDFYAPICVMGFCVLYHQTIIFIGGIVFISDGQYALWSQKVCQCIFQGPGDPIFKIFPLGAYHGGTLQDTDLTNSTETQSLRKHGCRQKCLDKSLLLTSRLDHSSGILRIFELDFQFMTLVKAMIFKWKGIEKPNAMIRLDWQD